MEPRGARTREYAHLFRLLHWALSITALGLIVSGISLHAAARPGWSVFSGVVPNWLWEGRVFIWHYWFAIVFCPSMLASTYFYSKNRTWLRLPQLILMIGGLGSVLTGVWMLFPFGPVNFTSAVTALHAAFGLVVVPLALLWHIVVSFTKNLALLVPSFRPFRNPSLRQILCFLPLVILTTWILFDGWPIRLPWRNLVAGKISSGRSDELVDLSSLPWEQAEPLDIRLVNGSGFYSGHTDLTLWALHDGREIFVKARWRDPIEDRVYTPWKRHPDGWEHLLSDPLDETVHYEDKFSLVFPTKPSWHYEQIGCALYCHVDGDFGWGYKGGQPEIDVWHWKSVRTDPVGQVDDKYWSHLDFTRQDVGRFGDPQESGGYEKNVVEGKNHPAFLPDPPSSVRLGAIPRANAKEYDPVAAESFRPGAHVPGIIGSPFVGDRGDITCQSFHRSDTWTLYMRRKLNTASPHDVQFELGESYSFGAAAFDRAAKRHAYSIPVFRLVIQD